jgi:hypothetical protein
MQTFVNDVLREAAEYEAPAPSPDVYVRTNTLKHSWSGKVTKSGRDLTGTILSSGAAAPYNRFVRGTKTQAGHMKRRGWRTVKQIADNHWPAAKRDFKKILSTPR